MPVIFRQLLDAQTWTYTYLLADPDSRDAILIDTVFEQHQRDRALLRELDLHLRLTLDTHVHADHVTGAWLMHATVGSDIAVGRGTGAQGAHRYLESGDIVRAGGVAVEARATPGHTSGCMTYVLDDRSMAFTGDALLIRGAGRTDFQQGDAHRLYKSVRERILSLPDDCLLYPGHDYNGRMSTTVREEKQYNPRLGDGVREEDFVGYMNNLGLPHPTRLDVAVPANLRCGRPEDGKVPNAVQWGPVVRTFAGVPEIEPDWVHQHRDELQLVDVREQQEIDVGAMGRIPGSIVVPLSELRQRVDELDDARPIITVCPSGARSAQAAQVCEKAGRQRVANLTGGLVRWMSLGYPTQ